MMKRLVLFLCLLAFLPLRGQERIKALFGARAPEGMTELSWTVDGVRRTALIASPAGSAATPGPVVFGWHGHFGNSAHSAKSWDIARLWPEATFVFPQGLRTATPLVDKGGLGSGWQSSVGAEGDRDIKFFDAMLADLKKQRRVDERKVYSMGHSNGAAFSYVLWQARPRALAAVGSVAGTLTVKARDMDPMPVIHVAGEKDPIVKYAWQQMTFAAVRRFNGCGEEGTPWAKEDVLEATLYASSKGAPLVTAVHSGGHEYAKGSSELIIRFFKERAAGVR